MACGTAIVAPVNDPCASGASAIGKQIVGILIQDPAGTAPTLTDLASVQAALAATGAAKLFIIPNLAGSTVPEGTDDSITGNDVPYGNTQVTGRTRIMQSNLQYLTKASLAVADTLAGRNAPLRYWEYDDQNQVQGPFQDAGMVIGVLQRAGIGGAPNRKSLTMSVRLPNLAEPPFLAAAIPGINNLQNAA